MANVNVQMTLDEAVAEVLGNLTGLDLQYEPELDRYQTITRQLNRGLRANALEAEWSYYADLEEVGVARAGVQEVALRSSVRPRIIRDDSIRLHLDGVPVRWIYYLPRDANSKYIGRDKQYVSITRSTLQFTRPFTEIEEGMTIHVPVMREPRMFNLPPQPEDPNDPRVTVPTAIRQQQLDFDYPDAVIARAAHFYAQTDPIMQPRVQTLEAAYKDIMYALIERDSRNTDAPFMNEFFVPIQNGIEGSSALEFIHRHPHSDERYL